MTSEMLENEQFRVHASTSWAWLIAAGSFTGRAAVPGVTNDRSQEMFRHPFVSEWNQQWHEREVDEMVRQRQHFAGRGPGRRIRRIVGRSIVSIGSFIGRSMVSVGHRLAAEPARSVARPR